MEMLDWNVHRKKAKIGIILLILYTCDKMSHAIKNSKCAVDTAAERHDTALEENIKHNGKDNVYIYTCET